MIKLAAGGNIAKKRKQQKQRKKKWKGSGGKEIELGHPCSPTVDSHTIELGSFTSKCSALFFALLLQLDNFSIEGLDGILWFFDRRHKSISFAFPSVHSFELGASPAVFGFDLLAEAALHCRIFGQIYEFHAARLASPIFIIALVCKTGPTPVPTRKSLLVVKAHAYHIG